MKQEIKELVARKARWADPLLPGESDRGFKQWYLAKHLPHFDAPGVEQFITYRLADSLPANRRSEWEVLLRIEDNCQKRKQIERYLDRGLGACHLRRHEIASIVQSSLWHNDGLKYRLLAWVIMPNHVHVLIQQWEPLGQIMKALKGYTSKQVNPLLHRTGKFWAEDYFDRYIRETEHERRVVHYIEQNPVKAGFTKVAEDWPWSSAHYRIKHGQMTGMLIHPTAQRLPPRAS